MLLLTESTTYHPLFICFWLHWFCCCTWVFSSGTEWGLPSSCHVQLSRGLRTWAMFLSLGFSSCDAQACSMACGIFLDQGSNPCPLHWQVDS